jgi:drug/metabolite transporter (DMT)-like permease
MKNRIISVLLIFVAALGWASSGLFINRITSHSDLSPLNLAFLRDSLAFMIFLAIVLIRRPAILKINPKDLIWLALMGGVGIGIFHALWNISVLINGIAVGTMLQYNEAIIITIAAVYFFHESMHWRKLLAIAGSLIGTALISGIMTLDTSTLTGIGLLVGLGSAVTHACFNLFGKKLSGSYPPLTIMVYAFGFASIALLPLQLISPFPTFIVPTAILDLLILAFGPTVLAFVAFTIALKRIPVSTANIIAIIEVPMAAIFGIVFLHETLNTWQMLGAGLVVGSVLLISLGRRKAI